MSASSVPGSLNALQPRGLQFWAHAREARHAALASRLGQDADAALNPAAASAVSGSGSSDVLSLRSGQPSWVQGGAQGVQGSAASDGGGASGTPGVGASDLVSRFESFLADLLPQGAATPTPITGQAIATASGDPSATLAADLQSYLTRLQSVQPAGAGSGVQT